MRKGNPYLRTALIESGLAASRAAGTALQARYQHVKTHRGHKKAVVAAGHHLLVIAYHVLAKDMTYQELGADYFDRLYRDRAIRRRIKQLEQLGYKVTLEEPAA
jgi:transposase